MEFVRKTVRTNCKYCRRPFDSFALSKVCPNCKRDAEEVFVKIDMFIKERPFSTPDDICQALNISRSYVKRYYTEPREPISDAQNITFVLCEICTTPIDSGRFCASCKKKLDDDFKRRLREK